MTAKPHTQIMSTTIFTTTIIIIHKWPTNS